MRWLLKKTIEKAAKKSDKAALDCTIKHWEQLASVSYEAYLRAVDRKDVSFYCRYCALCLRHYDHGTPCPLKKRRCMEGNACVKNWVNVDLATGTTWTAATAAMLAALKRCKE